MRSQRGAGICRMDGAAGESCDGYCPPNAALHSVDNSSGILNPYLSLVKQYGWANYMFQTNQAPAFPRISFYLAELRRKARRPALRRFLRPTTSITQMEIKRMRDA